MLQLGQAEIHQVRPSQGIDHDVARFDVTVQQALAVDVLQGIGQGSDPRRCRSMIGALPPQPFRQIHARNELRDGKKRRLRRAAHVVDRNDMRMIDGGVQTGFAMKRLHIQRRPQAFGVRHFHGNEAVQLFVARQQDLAEAALADHAQNHIATNACGKRLIGTMRNRRAGSRLGAAGRCWARG